MPSDTRLKIGTIVPASLITMLQQMPHNAMVRTQLHALLKWPVPASCETYEQIKNWIEGGQYAQLEGSIRPTGEVPQMPYIPDPDEIAADPYGAAMARIGDRDADVAVTATIRHRYTDTGNARFSCEYQGRSDYNLSTEEMNIMVDQAMEHEWGMDQILERATEILTEACNEDPPNCESVGENDYSDHETSDTVNSRSEVHSVTTLRRELLEWIREHRPDEYEDIQQ